MVVFINKNFTQIRPIFFPDSELVVIAYSNVVEVHNSKHNIMWKIEENSKVIKIDTLNNEQYQFYIGLQNGEIKFCDIKTKVITDTIHVQNEMKDMFISNEGILTIEKDCINFYAKSDFKNKKLISTKVSKYVSYSKKTGMIAMVENKDLSVLCLTANKIINHKLQDHKKTTIFTAVTCHPTESTVATADSKGKIQIWWDALNQSKKVTVLHWHFLSLNTLEFNYDGKNLLSGGREHVLVKWEISITSSERKKTFLPRLESDICSIQSFHGKIGEHYLITLADNSYQIINTSLKCINNYSNLVQRPSVLHEKVTQKCPLNPVGLTSCHNLPSKYQSSIILNGHEGKLQFFDLLSRSTTYQLDAVCQNWPTESENHLIPGFKQIKAMTVSRRGNCIATYESLGVETNPFDDQRCLKIFRWNDEEETFELESALQFDWMDKISDMVFHPVKEDFLITITNCLKVVLLTRRVERGVPNWVVSNVFELEEVLYRFKIRIETTYKKSPSKLVISEGSGKDVEGGLLVITKGDYLVVYEWTQLIMFNTKPVVAVTVSSLTDELEIGEEHKQKLCDSIVSPALFRNDKGCHRIVLGLHYGLVVMEMSLNGDGSVELKTVNSALSKFAVKHIAACPGINDSDARVAVLFESHVTVFNVWQDDTSTTQLMSIAALECVTWVRAENREKWALVGLRSEGNLRSVLVCDDENAQYFKETVVEKEVKSAGKNLLPMTEDVEQDSTESKPIRTRFHRRLDRSFLLYDAKSAPPASMILNAMYSI